LIKRWHDEEPGAPVVYEDDPGGKFRPLRLFVVWDKWAGVEERERSRVIMEAFRVVTEDDPQKLVRVTVAMGLLEAEARRLGILGDEA
jgi:hypothetical protein